MPSVLFICTANRFRSPLAAGILKKALAEEEKQRLSAWNIGRASDWEVSSAGLQAIPTQPVLPDVLEAAAQLGIDLSDHWSERVQDVRLQDYDLIVPMQASHKADLLERYPELQEQVYLFSQVVDNEIYDIPDAYQSPQGVMGVCAVMNDLIRRRLTYICVLAIAMHNKRVSA
jgi:protein-tyrosine-phosphatase